ncbi:hypothetical protein ACQSEB_16270 [Salmonella enterica]|uniref:hypothetical protein n=1 Tax=Salmonella enterica TaxID=28901 RepID=UPI000FC23218|nr:hypothetical protein [Salmonella enterica subsp. diarizonae]EHE1282202.1 hypothetical protein [Salmonella enterica]EJM5006426.1 hypothetical protein [Salmonella enterica]EKK6346626.1 hypothetical protein [Salmonella enterica]ELO7821535.1 hypothetical protein [Salmonella enterica]
MPKNTYPDCKDAVIEMLIGILVDVSAIAEAAHEYASRESEYAGSLVPYSLAVIQNSADQALQDVSNIMLSNIADSGIIQGVRHA